MNAPGAVLTDASVVSVLLREFSRQPVSEQARLKGQLENLIRTAIEIAPERDRIVLQASDGLVVVVFSGPQTALEIAERAAQGPAALPVCVGLNYGPVKSVGDADSAPELVGDGIVAARTLAKLATRGRLLVSRSFRDALQTVAPHLAATLAPVGAFTDANVRTHALFTPHPEAAAARRRQLLILGGLGVVSILCAGIAARVVRSSARRPGVIIFDIAPQGMIYVDGELKGVSPPLRRLELPPGAHTIEVRNTQYPPLKLAITAEPSQEMTVTHSFGGARKRSGKDDSLVEQLRRKWGL